MRPSPSRPSYTLLERLPDARESLDASALLRSNTPSSSSGSASFSLHKTPTTRRPNVSIVVKRTTKVITSMHYLKTAGRSNLPNLRGNQLASIVGAGFANADCVLRIPVSTGCFSFYRARTQSATMHDRLFARASDPLQTTNQPSMLPTFRSRGDGCMPLAAA